MIIRPTMSMPVLVDYWELNPLSTWVIPTNGCQEGPKNSEEKWRIIWNIIWVGLESILLSFIPPNNTKPVLFVWLGLTRWRRDRVVSTLLVIYLGLFSCSKSSLTQNRWSTLLHKQHQHSLASSFFLKHDSKLKLYRPAQDLPREPNQTNRFDPEASADLLFVLQTSDPNFPFQISHP